MIFYNNLTILKILYLKLLKKSLLISLFCIIYINNILIYNNIEKKYKNYINKVLAKLHNAKLYLNINKYILFIKQIKYLDLIITIKEIRINFEKVKYIFK